MYGRLLAAFFLLLSASLLAQSGLSGIVQDQSGLPVKEAIINLTSNSTGASSLAQTNQTGLFQFNALQPGNYRLVLTRAGFQSIGRNNIAITIGNHLAIDFTLVLGDSTEALEVSSTPPLLQSTRATVSFNLDQKRLVTLPLDGRNFVPLLALSPGVSLPPGNLLPRINGSRPRVSEYIYDGISVLQPEPGQVAYYPVIDAISEFRVETNSYAAEYGRSNGGVILVNQKSGTNNWHATLFEFFRNEALNARNLFATSSVKPRFRRNQFGGVIGGPLQKNKTFLFADWQTATLNTGVVRIATIPVPGPFNTPILDPTSRTPFPANTIPTSRFDPKAQAALALYPTPNLFNTTANNYRRIGNDDSTANQFGTRLDHHFTPRQRVFARYAYLRDRSTRLTPLPSETDNSLTRADSLAAEHTATLTATSLNQLRFGYTRRSFNRQSSLQNGIQPTYDIAGYQTLGPPANANAVVETSVTQFIEHLSSIQGRHNLKAGADIRLQSLNVLQPPSPSGNFQFTSLFTGNSFASFLLGQVDRYTRDLQPKTLKPRARIAEFFLQDDWRATTKLTLNAGLRYTLNFPSTIQGERTAVFNLNTEQLDFSRTARNLEKLNFAPRLGLAYKLNQALVIRAAYGLTWIEQAGITTPFTTPLFPYIQTLTEQSLDNITPAFILANGPSVRPQAPASNSGLGQGVFGVQRDNGSGYSQQWNFSIQKTIGQDWNIELGYLGSKLTRLGVPDVNLNQLKVEDLAQGSLLSQSLANPFFNQIPPTTSLGAATLPRAQLLRPYPRFTSVTLYRNNIGHSTYHSLQSRLEKRFSQRLTFTLAYTYSRLIDDAGAVFDSAVLAGPVIGYQAADSFNRRLEKDASTGNVPHNLASSFVYDLPHHWQVAGIIRAQSGSPIPVTQATNFNSFAGFGIQRPNRNSNPVLSANQRSLDQWFNTGSFTEAPQFKIGNSSRNPVVGPGYRTIDLMLGKTFNINERFRLEFRAEAFNLTNTPPLGNPNTSFGAPAFGSITTALDPRVAELVVKLHF